MDKKELTFEESYLLDILNEYHKGKSQAITAKELSHHGWNSRQLRRIVHDLRVRGYPICSGQEGYYYAETSHDIHATMKFLKSYLDEVKKAYDGIKDTYYTMKHQEIIDGTD